MMIKDHMAEKCRATIINYNCGRKFKMIKHKKVKYKMSSTSSIYLHIFIIVIYYNFL